MNRRGFRLDTMRHILFPALLAGVLLLGWFSYSPGLSGDFLFDDYPNLEALGHFGSVDSLHNLYSYLKAGDSGPFGRPISLLSFLIDDNTWPSEAGPFKRTNVLIHLLTALMVFWASFQLLQQIGRSESDALRIALLSTSIWLLHPFFVSTTLYVVQRMTQLAALFAIAGIVGYLHGRSLTSHRPRAGLVWMTLSLALGTGAAVLSKENGALLPVLILVVEWSLARHWLIAGPSLWWRLLFLWTPSALIVAYLARPLLGTGTYSNRAFNLEERILTQPRILWEYLQHLFIPRMQTRGLYQDGYNFSTGILVPWTTLAAIAGLIALIIAAVAARRRLPLISLAILFFLAGHLVESTTIGLELYFEHRNYLPAIFLFLPIAAGVFALRERLKRPFWLMLLVIPVLGLSALTYQRASLWGTPSALLAVWAQKNPDSPRAQSSLAQTLHNQGDVMSALAHLTESSSRLPSSALLSVRLVIHQVKVNVATQTDFERAASLARTQPLDAQSMSALRLLTDIIVQESTPNPLHVNGAHDLIRAFFDNPQYRNSRYVQRFLPYLQMRLYLACGKIDAAKEKGLLTIRRFGDIDAALSIVAEVASSGFPNEAMELMTEARAVFEAQPVRTLKRPASVYEQEIERLIFNIQEDIERSRNSGTPTLPERRAPLMPFNELWKEIPDTDFIQTRE